MTALVTGASRGIGREFARVLAENGYDLVVVARSAMELEVLKQELGRTAGACVIVIAVDLAESGAAEGIYARILEEGITVDVLVNNAGFGCFGSFLETDWETESEMIQCNVTTLTRLTKLLLPGMVERKRGRIVNVASTASFVPGPMMAVYYATKAYVLSFSESLAGELDGTGISVTALCPGPTSTDFNERAGVRKSRSARVKGLSTAREVAEYGYRSMIGGASLAVHGIANRLVLSALRFMPRSLVLRFARKSRKRE